MREKYDRFWSSTNIEKRDARSRQRGRAVLELLREREPAPVLDVGCGRGVVGEMLIKEGWKVWGVDFSREALGEAKERGLEVREGDLNSLEMERQFSLILCLEVLEHLADPARALKNIVKHLEPGGEIIISLPNEFHLLRRIGFLFGYFPFAGYDHPHLHLFSPSISEKFFRDLRLNLKGKKPLSLVPPQYPRVIVRLGEWLGRFSPTFFSLSVVYLLQPENQIGTGQREENQVK